MQLTPFPTPGEPLQFQQAYQTHPKMHIIRVLFQNQTLYKTCKIGKKGCISDHVNKIWKGHDKPIKQNSNKNLYLQTLHLKKTKKTKNKKTKQNKTNKHFFKDTTISIGIEKNMNFQNYPHPPPTATILTLHRKYALPELFHCTTLSYKFFAIQKSPHLL